MLHYDCPVVDMSVPDDITVSVTRWNSTIIPRQKKENYILYGILQRSESVFDVLFTVFQFVSSTTIVG